MADKVTAFEYDNATTGSEAPVSFGVIPGVWTPGEAVLPEAFGMTLQQMRDAVHEYNLPLKEVRVAPAKARAELDRGPNRMETEGSLITVPAKPSDAYVETKDGPIPAPAPEGVHKPLQPLAAAMQARNTVLSQGGSLEDAAKAARAIGGAAGEQIADLAETAAADWQRALDAQAADEQAVADEPVIEVSG